MTIFSLFCLVFVLIFISAFGNEIVIQFGSGHIKGIETISENGNPFFSFRGIPYAEAPVGELRFQAPVSKMTWGDDILDATQDGPPCPQIDIFTNMFVGQEDNCLVLNVYTSKLPSENAEKRPVMVYIHGGSFVVGSGSSELYNPRRLIDSGVVLVTLNYRLGALGFMSTANSASPGNYGLLDQLAALKWVKNNIAQFGGDEGNIILFGCSAGSASVIYHTISPLSKGFFQKAIAISGSPLCLWGYQPNPLIWSQKAGSDLGCPIHETEKLVDCLRKVPLKTFTETTHSLRLGFLPLIFTPTVDHYFLPESPHKLLANGEVHKDIAIMSGFTKDEGSLFYGYLPTALKTGMTKDNLKELIKDVVGISAFNDEAAELIKEKYFHDFDSMNNEKIKKNLIKMYSEGLILNCAYQTAHFMSKAGIKTYLFSYDFEPAYSILQSFGIEESLGATHLDDHFMLFDGPFFKSMTNDTRSEKMKRKYQLLLTDFAKFGHPTSNLSEDIPLTWTEVQPNEMSIYHINDQITIDKHIFEENNNYKFWMETVPKVLFKTKKLVADEL